MSPAHEPSSDGVVDVSGASVPNGRADGPANARLALVAGALGALAIAFSGILVRLSAAEPATAAVFRCAYAVPVLALLAARERGRHGRRSPARRRRSLAAGVAFAVDLVSWHAAIAFVGAGLATVLANVQVVIVGLVAWVALGERPSRATVAAVPIMLTGVVLISGVVGRGAYGDRPMLGAVLGLVAAAAYSGFILLLRAGNRDQHHRADALFDATLIAGVAALAAGPLAGGVDLVPSWPAHGWLVVLALNSQVMGWLLISYALPRLQAVVTSVLLLLQPVGAVLLGMVLLGESPSPVQLGGVGLVLLGVVAVTGSDRISRRWRPRTTGQPARSSSLRSSERR